MSTGDPEQTNQPPASKDTSPAESTAPPKRRASDLMSGDSKASLGEFGSLDITGFPAVSDAARAVREAMGLSPADTRSSSSETLTPPARQEVQPLAEEPQPEVIQPSTRLGDISSQFGKLIIDGFQAVSGAFRGGKAAQRPAHQTPGNTEAVRTEPTEVANSAELDRRGGSLSDRFSKLIMDKFRAIVDSRWHEQIRSEREVLVAAIDKVPHEVVREEIQRNMTEFERRAQSQKLDIGQVKNTYRSVLFLIEDLRRQSALNETGRLLLALQVIRLAAYPEQVTAGRFATSDVVQVERATYLKAPAAAAHLIAEIALYNEFMSHRGLQVRLPAEELHADRESRDPIGNNGANRSYASQLFQQAALNLHYSRYGLAGMQAHYRFNPADDSEELITADGRQLTVDSSSRSINVDELYAEIAGDVSARR